MKKVILLTLIATSILISKPTGTAKECKEVHTQYMEFNNKAMNFYKYKEFKMSSYYFGFARIEAIKLLSACDGLMPKKQTEDLISQVDSTIKSIDNLIKEK